MPVADYSKRNKKLMERIEGSEEISERNKEILEDFERDLKVGDECGDSRIYKLLQHLKIVGEHVDFDFDNSTEEDLKKTVAWIKDRDLARSTKRDYKVVLKRFYKWLNDGEYPESVDFIKTTAKNKDKKLPKNLLKEEDIKKLLESANHNRDQALISLLWETGARIGELIDLKIGDLEDHKHGFEVVISGKTGPRQLLLISSVPYLKSWLNSHPHKEDQDAWLWVNIGNTNFGKKMEYRTILKMLNQTKKRAGINKDVNPHQFRHSRATYLASKFTESQLCDWMGWVQGSDQAQTYVHMSGRDTQSTYAKIHGIEEEEEEEKSILAPEKCPRCDDSVPPDAAFCQSCGQQLTREMDPIADHMAKKSDKKIDLDEEALELGKKILEKMGENKE